MKRFTSYMDAAKYCIARKIDLTRIVRLGLYAFKVGRAS
jgi:hypothetical protein